MIGIYKITSPTGKHYIGQSINVERRIKGYRQMSNCNRQRILYNSLKKHGTDLHEFSILETLNDKLSNEEMVVWLNDKEIFYSLKFNSLSPSGLNLVIGGKHGFASEELKQRFSEMRLGSKSPMYGKHQSEETKKKNRESQLGEKSKMYGKPKSIETRKRMSEGRMGVSLSDEHKQKISTWRKGKTFEEIFGKEKAESMKNKMSVSGRRRIFTEEHKQNISKGLKGEKHYMFGKTHSEKTKEKFRKARANRDMSFLRKSVDQYSLTGEFICTHRSIMDAEKYVNAHCSDVGRCLRGYQKTAKGYNWKYHNQTQLI